MKRRRRIGPRYWLLRAIVIAHPSMIVEATDRAHAIQRLLGLIPRRERLIYDHAIDAATMETLPAVSHGFETSPHGWITQNLREAVVHHLDDRRSKLRFPTYINHNRPTGLSPSVLSASEMMLAREVFAAKFILGHTYVSPVAGLIRFRGD